MGESCLFKVIFHLNNRPIADLSRRVFSNALHELLHLLHTRLAIGKGEIGERFSMKAIVLVDLMEPIDEGEMFFFGERRDFCDEARRRNGVFIAHKSAEEITIRLLASEDELITISFFPKGNLLADVFESGEDIDAFSIKTLSDFGKELCCHNRLDKSGRRRQGAWGRKGIADVMDAKTGRLIAR